MNNQQVHDSRGIANIFVQKAREVDLPAHRLTVMSLVKYVYFAHGWTLGYTGKPLIYHNVRAWKYGPVIPEVYYAFRKHGFIILDQAKKGSWWNEKPYTTEPTERQSKIIDGVFSEYSKLDAFEMSDITHHTNSPWSKYRGNHSIIPDKEIQEYYESVIARIKDGE